jgi:hypothetical protein
MALEGVLLNVYSGDENAVATMIKLIEGSEEKTKSVSGDELQTTCMFHNILFRYKSFAHKQQLPTSRQRPLHMPAHSPLSLSLNLKPFLK